jgi:hypothetical protein
MSLRKVFFAVVAYGIAFFLSVVANKAIHTFVPNCAEMVENAFAALMVVLILFATGFVDKLNLR